MAIINIYAEHLIGFDESSKFGKESDDIRVIESRKLMTDIKKSQNDLEMNLDEKRMGNVTLMFLNPDFYVNLTNLENYLRRICVLKGKMEWSHVPIDIILDYHQIHKMSDAIINKAIEMIEGNIYLYENLPALSAGGDLEAEGEVGFSNLIEETFVVSGDVYDFLKEAKDRLSEYKNKTVLLFHEIEGDEKLMVYNAINLFMSEYTRDRKDDETKRLKRQAQKLKEERAEKLSCKHWSKVLENEESAIKLASKGKFAAATEECYEEYDDAVRFVMDNNRLMMKEILRISTDDELFDMEQLINGDCRIIELLTTENILLFARLVLRGNIIRCKMNDEVKRKMDMWIGKEERKEVQEESVNWEKRAQVTSSDVLTNMRAMCEWRKLQRRGWIDDNLKPKTNLQSAAVIASVLGDKLGLNPKWSAFEELWEVKGLATKLSRALRDGNCQKYYELQKEVQKVLGLNHKRE